uniref:Odorant receptor n=1 Tax=Ceracris kiangsu TaxID=227354 RepID=A0A6M6DJU1_CERKI|nr:odorant receptor 9 [Ceracris kiangsu]
MVSKMERAASPLPATRPPPPLEYLLRLLHWTGVMRHPRADSWSGRAFYIRKVVVSVAISAFLISQALALWTGGTADIDRFTLLLCTFNTVLAWLFRLGHIALHERELHYLTAQVDRDFGDFLRPRDVHLVQTHDRHLRRIVLAYIWFSIAGCLWWIIFPLLRFGFCAEGLPFIMELPYEVTSPAAFIPTWFFCSILTLHPTPMTIAVDSFNVSLVAQLRVQLTLLSRNIIELANEDKDRSPVLVKHISSGNDLSSESVNGIHIARRLRKMILHHQAIIRNTELLEKCLGVMLLGQSLSIGTSVCFQLFQVALSAGSVAEAGKFGCYLSVMLAQLFVYCWFGDDLITESEKVSLAAYSAVTSLHGIPIPQKRSLLLLMVRAQRPLRITAGGFFPLSRESFVSVVNMSYSFFAILRNFKGE